MKFNRNKSLNVTAFITAAALTIPYTHAFAGITASAAGEGIKINEICAKNSTHTAPDGNCYDWIELYNPNSSAVDLSGCGLSDKDSEPFKFTFPSGTSIGAGQRIVVYCDSVMPEINGAYTASFGLSTSGETVILTSPDNALLDSVDFPALASDQSYGRIPDGSDNFALMNMSPNNANRESDMLKKDIEEPIFSQQGGFYDSGFNLNITVPSGTKVYYTTDGSVPDSSSQMYSSPIAISDISSQPNYLSARTDIRGGTVTAPTKPVDKAMVINAVAIDSNGNVSDTVSAAYFIGYGNRASYYQNVKVISLTTHEDNLFGHDKGIYVLGATYDEWKNTNGGGAFVQEWQIPGNYSNKGREWERPAIMQIYEDGQVKHTQNIGIRIHGGASRSHMQKSFNIYARADYGVSKFDFNLFDGDLRSEYTGKKIKEFDSFMIRNGGNDASATRFRDKLNQALVSDRDMLTQAMKPCIVFINGEYWGHYEITEKLSDDYIEAHYGIDKNDVCLIKNGELEEGTESDFAEWESLQNWFNSNDLSQTSNYNQLCEKIDMQSFIDYMCAEIYYGNMDFSPNNTAMWKSTSVYSDNEWGDGKWRFILFDTEYSTGLYGGMGATANHNTFDMVLRNTGFISELLKNAMNNDTFKRQFATTFMDMANENFNNEKVQAMIEELTNEYRDMTIDTLDRFEPKDVTQTPENPQNPQNPGGFPNFGGNWGGQVQDNATTFNNEVQSIKTFYNDRNRSVTEQLRNTCSLKGNKVNITLNNDAAKGTVILNTITPTFKDNKWTGSYYTDYPVTLTAKAQAGYAFSHWETSDGKTINTPTAEISLTSDMTVTAVYTQSGAVNVKGDVNSDGTVSAADLVLLNKWLLGAENNINGAQADVHSDGVIDVYDMITLRKIVIGK
ncbi:MAG: CotH kinase family protein [Ruminococcus sp.]|nr:CotH kinase family protein [Ruminococcus sp.]